MYPVRPDVYVAEATFFFFFFLDKKERGPTFTSFPTTNFHTPLLHHDDSRILGYAFHLEATA